MQGCIAFIYSDLSLLLFLYLFMKAFILLHSLIFSSNYFDSSSLAKARHCVLKVIEAIGLLIGLCIEYPLAFSLQLNIADLIHL